MFENVKDTITTSVTWIKQAWKSKTMRFSLLLMIAGAVQQGIPYLQSLIPPAVFGFVVMFIGMVVGFLRMITTMPLSQK